MPKRQDLKRVMIISSGPIVIGQGCEFDYSGTQACKALREEGISVVLLNSNPATIMTDPEMADRTYVEPITVAAIDKILARERELGTPIDALLPTLGGQTGLNCAMEASESGVLKKHNVQLIGANEVAIHKAEDRTEFKNAMLRIGLDVPRSGIAHTWEESQRIVADIGLPVVIRPAYTLGGTGGGFATTMEEFETICKRGLEYSRVHEILIEQSALGWKEYELEVMRDRADNVVIICSIENFDAMGVHTGDSITVAPAQTLTDKEYQRMRDAAIKIIREIGVETGGSNIQFAVHPETGRMIVVEMNPRVSRSSALASKATGYPIARIAAKLAIGYTLDEIPNDITRATPASFEPTIDYCVVKIPRWTFEKFPEANETLTTQMKSVGEAMSIGRTFKEAFQKGIRSMEIKRFGLGLDGNDLWLASRSASAAVSPLKEPRASARAASEPERSVQSQGATGSPDDEPVRIVKSRHLSEAPADTKEEHATEWPIPQDVLHDKLSRPCQGRPYYIRYAFKMGWTVEQVYALTYIDPWFLENMKELVDFEDRLVGLAQQHPSVERVMSALREVDLSTAGQAGHHTIPPSIDFRSPSQTRGFFEELQRLTDTTQAVIAHVDNLGVALKELGDPGPALMEFEKLMREAKQLGYSDIQIAKAWKWTPRQVREFRESRGIKPVYKLVDTCAAEFEAVTPYYYSTYETPAVRVTDDHNEYSSEVTGQLAQLEVTDVDDEIRVSDKPKVIILGGGPNRIGQGIEFDYCCVHAVMQARALGYETVMINSNPETVSTDYDTSDLLFFEPLTHEDVLNICERLNGRALSPPNTQSKEPRASARAVSGTERTTQSPASPSVPGESGVHTGTSAARAEARGSLGLLKGVVVQYGGQTPLNLAKGLKDAGVPILGTSPESIHLAEDRNEFQKIVRELGLRQPEGGIAYNLDGAVEIARKLGYPVLVRPSYVLGGRAMEKCHIEEDLIRYMRKAMDATDRAAMVDEKHPILVDKFLSAAVEVDVDCISDGKRALVCGMMEHIEEAGIHSGDSACSLPPYTLSPAIVDEIKRQTELIAIRLQVSGLMNIQFAVKDDLIYLIEVNPRASRTVPFVSKATGVPWAKLATRVMLGESLTDVLQSQGIEDTPWPRHISVKEAVFPFNKFPEVDCVLGPEMRSTGEVMGIDRSFALAFAKAQMAAGNSLPTKGTVLISVNDRDKETILPVARVFAEMGFRIISTAKTLEALSAAGIPAELVKKQQDPQGPYLIDMINGGQVNLLINTPVYWGSAAVESRIRSAAVMHNIPLVTTITGARAAVQAIKALREGEWGVRSIQEFHRNA